MNSCQNQIRKFENKDLPAVARIYRESIHQIAKEFYSEDQIRAWSGFADETEEFKRWVNGANTYVAVDGDNKPVGFAGIQSNGRISSLFIDPEYTRKGLATELLNRLRKEAKLLNTSILTTEASELSKSLFEKYGFSVTEIEHTVIKGIKFKRFKMQANND